MIVFTHERMNQRYANIKIYNIWWLPGWDGKPKFKIIPWLFKWEIGKSREHERQGKGNRLRFGYTDLRYLNDNHVKKSSRQLNYGFTIGLPMKARIVVIEVIHKEKMKW